MKNIVRASVILLSLSTALLLSACAQQAKPQMGDDSVKPLNLFVGSLPKGWHFTLANFETQLDMTGDQVTMPKPKNPDAPNSKASAYYTQKDAPKDAITLDYDQAWYASLRIEGGTMDLRPYLAKGVVSFDLNVVDLAHAGLAFRMNCGEHCDRKVNYLVQGRALQGKGWQHMSFALSCFYRAGDDFSAVPQVFSLDSSGTGKLQLANVRILPEGTPVNSCPDYKTISVVPNTLNESWSVDWWMPRHEEKLAKIKEQLAKHEGPQLVFIGDSITHNWEKYGVPVWNQYYAKYHALNLGFGGDRTENILWRLEHGEIDGIDPKVVVMMLGTNNTGDRAEDPVTTAAGIKRDIEEVQKRLPNSKILLLGIFARGADNSDYARQLNQRINGIISSFADNKTIFFLNINSHFLDEDGNLLRDQMLPDLLHPNEKGYQVWARAIDAELHQLMGE